MVYQTVEYQEPSLNYMKLPGSRSTPHFTLSICFVVKFVITAYSEPKIK